MSRKTSALVLIVLTIAVILIPNVYAEYPIDSILIVKDLPDTMIAGNSYEMLITFDNVAKVSIYPIVKITVTSEEPIGYNEIFIDEINLNGFDLDYIELPSGIFTTVEGDVDVSPSSDDNELSIIVYTAINLMPGTYHFEIDLLGEEVFDYVEVVPADTPTTIDASEEVGVSLEDFTSTELATVTIILYEENPYPEAEVPPDSLMALGIFLDFKSTVEDFTTQIRVYYTDEEVEAVGIEEEDLRLYWFEDPSWVQCDYTGVNTYENYVWADVTHFTIFAPFGTEAEEEPEPTPSPPSRPNKKPVANAGLNQTVYIGEFVEFSGIDSYDPDGTIKKWTWSFGDGVEAYGVNVSHRYLEEGSYIVILTVRDNKYGEDTDTCTITVIEPVFPVPPLPPILDNLNITPAEIELGDNVTIRFDIRSLDNQPITYGVDMEIRELTLRIWVDLGAYESKTVSRTITPDTDGNYTVTVDGLAGNFTVKPAPIPLKPAEFVWENLTYPNEIQEGEAFELSIDVINIGETAGYDCMYIKINGIDTHVMSVQLEPGHGISKTWITFYLYEVGNYSLEMDALEGATFEGMFTVLEIPEEPVPPFWEQPVWIVIGIVSVGIAVYLYLRWQKTRPVRPPKEFANDLDT